MNVQEVFPNLTKRVRVRRGVRSTIGFSKAPEISAILKAFPYKVVDFSIKTNAEKKTKTIRVIYKADRGNVGYYCSTAEVLTQHEHIRTINDLQHFVNSVESKIRWFSSKDELVGYLSRNCTSKEYKTSVGELLLA